MSPADHSNIPIFDPSPEIESLRDEIEEAIRRVLDHGQFILGPEVEAFEEKAAEYLDVKHAVGVNSGTDALVIGLRAAGVGEGDEVITTPFSFFATAESISMIGARPVFADIEEESFNIDPELIEEAITEKTRAIVPVHLYGNPCRMDRIMEIARSHELKVVEDCAQSFGASFNSRGSEYDGRMTGSMGEVGAFSFFPTKNLGGAGDGGLIATDDDSVAEQARMLRTHGSKKKYRNETLGYNSRLDTIQAAVLNVKLARLDAFNGKRREVASWYEAGLSGLESVKPPDIVEGHVVHQYTIRVSGGKRDELKQHLAARGIGTNIYYPIPQSELPVYKGQFQEYPVCNAACEEVLSLPIWPEIERAKVERVVEEIRGFFG